MLTCKAKTVRETLLKTLQSRQVNQIMELRINLKFTNNFWMETIKREMFKGILSSQSSLILFKQLTCKITSSSDHQEVNLVNNKTAFNLMPQTKTNSIKSSIKRRISDLLPLIRDLKTPITLV